MKKVLITGVAGFIGSHVAKKFVREGYQVIGVDDLTGGRIENIPNGIDFIKADLSDSSIHQILPPGCNLILHLAGQSSGEISFDNPVLDLQKNTISTINLIQYGIRNKSKRIVYASSMSVYGEVEDLPISELHQASPLSCYGVGKLSSEGYLKVFQNQLPFVILRMFNVYGPGQDLFNLRQGMVSIYLSQAIKSGKIEVKGNLNRYRDFIFIDDVIEAWYRSATYESAKNQIINLGTGYKTTISKLLETICNYTDGSSIFVQGSTPGDQNGIYADNRKLNNILDINKFTQLNEGILIFKNWANNFLDNYNKINKNL